MKAGDFSFRAQMAAPVFGFFENVPELFDQLYVRLADYGLEPSGMRLTNNGRNLGETVMSEVEAICSLPARKVVLRLRVDRVDIQCSDLTIAPLAELGRITAGGLEAVKAYVPRVEFLSYAWSTGVHGLLSDSSCAEFVARFVARTPTGLGGLTGAGCAFYFAETPDASTTAVTLDMSGIVDGGLHVRTAVVCDPAQTASEALDQLLRRQQDKVFEALHLALES
jgi:hypothetical protein